MSQHWQTLGQAIREDRERQGLTREALAERVRARGGTITTRTIGSLERGVAPKTPGKKPPTLAPTVAALGWPPRAADRILAGEDPAAVLCETATLAAAPARPATVTREGVLELLPGVYEFSRGVVALGGDAALREEFDELAQELAASIPVGATRSAYGLMAYRPHAVGEGIPDDDAERIAHALGRDA